MATTANGFSVSCQAGTRAVVAARANRGRSIDRKSGHALEILGHAIEHLTDEFVAEATQVSPSDPRLEAIQLLMALNRQIYFECPIRPTLGDVARSFFGIRTP
jgi:hypothetical protein